MKIVEYSISENTLIYCHSTSEYLLKPGDMGLNPEANAIIGHWLDEIMNEPHIKDKELEKAWEKCYNDYLDKEDDELHPLEVLVDFLKEYNNPSWMVYQITERGMACGPTYHTAWLVVPADTMIQEMTYMDEIDEALKEGRRNKAVIIFKNATGINIANAGLS